MTTALEERLIAALDQMARAAVPDQAEPAETDETGETAIAVADTHDDQAIESAARIGVFEVPKRPSHRRVVTIAATLVLALAGMVAVAAAVRNDRDDATNAPTTGPSPTVQAPAPTAEVPVSTDVSPPPTPEVAAAIGTDPVTTDESPAVDYVPPQVEPDPFQLVAIVDPAVAGGTPLRQHHVDVWFHELDHPSVFTYRARTGTGYDAVSWSRYPPDDGYPWALDLPVDDELSASLGVDVRRQVFGDHVTMVLTRVGDEYEVGVSLDLPLDQETALQGWLQLIASQVADQGDDAADVIPVPDGFTVISPLDGSGLVFYDPPPLQTPTVVHTERFADAIDPMLWIAVKHPAATPTEPIDLAEGTAWRLNDPEALADDDRAATVVWQPRANIIVELSGSVDDIDRLASGLTLVPTTNDIVRESTAGRYDSIVQYYTIGIEGPGYDMDPPPQLEVEILADTPVGRFAYLGWKSDHLVCNGFLRGGGSGGANCSMPGSFGPPFETPCEIGGGGSFEDEAYAFAFVDAADAEFVEIRRQGGDAEPVPTQIFTGESNGRQWALVYATFDGHLENPIPDIRFTGGACFGVAG